MEEGFSDQLWRLTMHHSPVGMALVATSGRLLAVNASLCEMLGRGEDELRRLSFQEVTHPDDLDADLELLAQTLAGERTSYRIVKRYLHADGHVVWADLSVALLREADGEPIHLISQVVDITQQRRYHTRLVAAEEQIEREERRAEAVYTSVDVGLVLLDAEGRYEAMNRRHGDFIALAYPDGHRGWAGQRGAVYAEDGVRLLVPEEMPTRRAVAGEEFDDLRIWVGDDPATRRALSVSSRTVRGLDGSRAGAALAYKDVTDYLEALAVKDEFVASVSHELQTPLTSVLGHLEMLTDSRDLAPDHAVQLAVVERNARRLRSLVADLLQVAADSRMPTDVDPVSTDLVPILVEALGAARPALSGAGLELVADLPASTWVNIDANRIRQVVDNLVSNAVKYSERGGTVEVRLEVAPTQVELSVSDDGLGMAPSDLERLFTRFFRGAAARERQIVGTGLGLNIAHTIVEAHGGTLTAISELGVGSTFTMCLPVPGAGPAR